MLSQGKLQADNSKIVFKNYDADKMVVNVNGRPSVENLINSSFNEIIGDKYRSSRLGDSILKPTNVDLSLSKIRKSLIPSQENNNKLEYSTPIDNIGVNPNPNSKEVPFKARSSVNLNLNCFNTNGNLDDDPQNTFQLRITGPDNSNNRYSFAGGNNLPALNQRHSDLRIGNLNDLSISVIQGVNSRKNSSVDNNIGLSFRPSLSGKNNIFQGSKFKKFTYKQQGKDEDGNEIVNLDNGNKDQIIAHDLDNSGISGTDQKLLDDIFFDEDEEYLTGTDEHVEDRKTFDKYQFNFKGIISKSDKIAINNVIKNFYMEGENEEVIPEDKIKILESELIKLRNFQENILLQKENLENLKKKLTSQKDNLNSSIQNEIKKIDKLSKLKASKLNEYDKVKLMTSGNVDIDKYISPDIDEDDLDDDNFDHNAILVEIENLKLKYEQKSNKYKEIIKKLKTILTKRQAGQIV